MTSTSAAAHVKEHPEEKIAAIANEAAAEKYGLTIVRRSIHTHKIITHVSWYSIRKESSTPE